MRRRERIKQENLIFLRRLHGCNIVLSNSDLLLGSEQDKPNLSFSSDQVLTALCNINGKSSFSLKTKFNTSIVWSAPAVTTLISEHNELNLLLS
jgi:hypothetical protein